MATRRGMEQCIYCTKWFNEGQPMETHDAKCPKREEWHEAATASAVMRAEEERVAAVAAAEREAAERQDEEQADLLAAVRRRNPSLEPQNPPILDPAPSPPRRWVVTKPNSFGVYKLYPRQPTHDPDRKRTTADLCRTSELAEDAPKLNTDPWYHPFANSTHALLMEYHLLVQKDSNNGTNQLLDLMRDPSGDFRQDDIGDFKVEHGHAILDKLAKTPPGEPKSGWRKGSVLLRIPPGRLSDRPILEIHISDILYRRPVDIVREAFTTAAFERLHTTPFSLRADPTHKEGRPWPYDAVDIQLDACGLPKLPPGHQDMHGEMYNAARTLRAFNELPACEEEPVIVSLMPASDGTHLAQFGTAAMQPGYLFLGNQSKYDRAKPSMNAYFHMVYFPKVCCSFCSYSSTNLSRYSSPPISQSSIKLITVSVCPTA